MTKWNLATSDAGSTASRTAARQLRIADRHRTDVTPDRAARSHMRSPRIALALATAVCAALIGCASDVVRTPTRFAPVGVQQRADIVLAQSVAVAPDSGYAKTLKAGSRWRHVGDIPEGAVFKIENDVFTLEGRHRHEAYCVLNRADELVGFYLPVERGFVAVTPAVPLPITQNRS